MAIEIDAEENRIREPARATPVVRDVDVLVCDGGLSRNCGTAWAIRESTPARGNPVIPDYAQLINPKPATIIVGEFCPMRPGSRPRSSLAKQCLPNI